MSTDGGKILVIGASAGGVDALSAVLPRLPRDFPPVLVVIHLPAHKNSILAGLFADRCQMRVVEAEDKIAIEPGTIYFAPPDYHLLVEADHTLSLSSEAPVWFSRPSIDVLFETAADAYGPALTGIILTGANEDGASGLRRVLDLGGQAIIQSPDTAYARAMPQSAADLCPEATLLPLREIADHLLEAAA
ncbi:MAG: chemotaxis protein CheB [Asticcacaulis sp.]